MIIKTLLSLKQFSNMDINENILSPTSTLRLNFDHMPSEMAPDDDGNAVIGAVGAVGTCNIDGNNSDLSYDNGKKMLWGVTVPPFVSDKVSSWIEDTPKIILFKGIHAIKKIENVRMIDRYNVKNPTIGTLYLTATHLIFADRDENKETWILHMHIGSVDKQPLSTTGSPLLIRCKTFLSVTFVIPKERECHDVYTTLMKLCQPVHMTNLYCFHYTPSNDDQPKSSGWDFFTLDKEFKRMRVPNEQWTMCPLNQTYELCDTYPQQIFIPIKANRAMQIGSSKFRSKNRLPALTYLHSNKASICRCSQPLSGFSARCLEDEQMLEAIRNTNPNSDYMYVVDTRPRINAMANRAAGKGYENEAFYENTKFQFLGIENIHVMRTSLQKLIETCEQKSPTTMNAFLSSLESSGWLKHIRSILETSSFIANEVDKGVSVVVHCSDGWDRTAQVCSLAALMLDPFYRTIKGYQVLIEKDWLAFGHKFSERCGHIQTDPKEMSPVFTQFLDCTFQLMAQRPDGFEFNERFLLTLHDHVQSCQFGTFIGNCEKDRLDLRVSERTYSLWGYMSNNLHEYVNPLYRPNMDEIMQPNLSPQLIRFWRGMYGRFESGVHPREPLDDLLIASRDHCTSLEDHVQHLTKRITNFKNLISKSAKKLQNVTRTNREPIDDDDDVDNVVTDNKYNYENNNSFNNKKMNEFYSADDDHPLKASDFTFSNLSIQAASNNNNINNNTTQSSEENQQHNLLMDGGDDGDGDGDQQLTNELNSVAVDWQSLRNRTKCSCSTPFDQANRKSHCWKCGEVFCARCIDRTISLAGHDSGQPVPVCRTCFKNLQPSPP